MIRISAFADEVSTAFKKQLELLSTNGVGYLELRFIDGMNIIDVDRNKWVYLKQMMDDYHIQVSAIASPIGKSCITSPFEDEFIRFKRTVEIASIFETQFIRVFSYYPPLGSKIEDFRNEVLQRFHIQTSYLEGTDIIMVHENESGIYGHSASNCLDLMETIDSPSLRQAYDPANFVWGESIVNNIEQCFSILKNYIVHVHIKDWILGSKDVGAFPGEGDAQIASLIWELKRMNYKGFLTLEPHLSSGSQYGGITTVDQFEKALALVKTLCDLYEL
ncbi:sugar phosphate isomerase/epimerase [Parabacteroides acidifaciens]|uniref:Sugar phosphate isomerase/epimerase n=1 Tax=Parabacteroides acidifaciens TaxID=2290935 RepID=A0A3D8HBH1_9BACT|nr:sugar phosphate isomerase/epimerase family protein [Parabacteroides acidifaciens]MBC8603012.1 sugar phosphate isomerase/epimerase [Parabacteroides acidifaciens]RDU48278.1 sugar phosphate isomerase/epimerase [Parabacteroides acidifaciens]